MAGRLAAVTGATGFLGRHIVRALAQEGWSVRALVRSERALWAGPAPDVVRGDLADADALARLCRGAHAVVHAAGLVRARRDDHFAQVNAGGAARTADAALRVAPDAAFVLVSSLAAREPQLSAYARSKRDGETAVQAAYGGRAQVARPCAVYGPGDRATLPLFRAAVLSPVLPVPSGAGRLTLVHAADCARAVAAMADRPVPGRTVALTDDRPDGYGWAEIVETLARAAGRRPLRLGAPDMLLRGLGRAGDVARFLGASPMVTSGKVRELLHPDWSVAACDRLAPPDRSLSLLQGFTATLERVAAERHHT